VTLDGLLISVFDCCQIDHYNSKKINVSNGITTKDIPQPANELITRRDKFLKMKPTKPMIHADSSDHAQTTS